MRTETQSAMSEPAGRDENLRKIGTLIEGIEIAMLTTVDVDGFLSSRPMATQQLEFDGTLYFFSKEDTLKAIDIERNPHVNVGYAHPKKQDYVSISGTARISHDRSKMQELWRPDLKAWFPQELEIPGICLIVVDAVRAEYWDSPNNVIATTLALVQNTLSGESKPVGDHAKVTL